MYVLNYICCFGFQVQHLGTVVQVFSMFYKIQYRVFITLQIPSDEESQKKVGENVLPLLRRGSSEHLKNNLDRNDEVQNTKKDARMTSKSWINFITFVAFEDSFEAMERLQFDIKIQIPDDDKAKSATNDGEEIQQEFGKQNSSKYTCIADPAPFKWRSSFWICRF